MIFCYFKDELNSTNLRACEDICFAQIHLQIQNWLPNFSEVKAQASFAYHIVFRPSICLYRSR